MSEYQAIKDYVRGNYEYDKCDDPMEVVKITQYDQQAVELVPKEAGFSGVLEVGDWFIRDDVNGTGYLVRIVDGEVVDLWNNVKGVNY